MTATPWYAWNHQAAEDDEPTCSYNSRCEDAPDPDSSTGLCTYHMHDDECDGEEWPR